MKTLLRTLLGIFLPETERERRLRTTPIETLYKKLHVRAHERFAYVTTFFVYKDPLIKDMVWALKYNRKEQIAPLFGQIIYDYLLEESADHALFATFTNPILIPIPISKQRAYERGYNQTERVAKAIKSLDTEELFKLETTTLHKRHSHHHQARTTNKAQRAEHIQNSFYIKHPEKIVGKNIFLIDDVITTGTTIEEARKTLLGAGAKEVRALVVAR